MPTYHGVILSQVCEEPNTISLASVDPVTGMPSVRVVLLKGFDDRGFIWYTNYSRYGATGTASNGSCGGEMATMKCGQLHAVDA